MRDKLRRDRLGGVIHKYVQVHEVTRFSAPTSRERLRRVRRILVDQPVEAVTSSVVVETRGEGRGMSTNASPAGYSRTLELADTPARSTCLLIVGFNHRRRDPSPIGNLTAILTSPITDRCIAVTVRRRP